MAIPPSDEIRKLLDRPNFAHLATLMPDGSPQSVPVWDAYSPDLFSASYERADVQIEASGVEVIDGDTYRVAGATQDGRLSWDLRYVREVGAWFAADRMRVGTLAWEQMSWVVYTPRAAVSGQLTVDGRAYAVAAWEYHHNWESGCPPTRRGTGRSIPSRGCRSSWETSSASPSGGQPRPAARAPP